MKKRFYGIRKGLLRQEEDFERVKRIINRNTTIKNPYINELFEEHMQVSNISNFIILLSNSSNPIST